MTTSMHIEKKTCTPKDVTVDATTYYLTAKGATRFNLPLGTPLERANKNVYSYLVSSKTETPFTVKGDKGGCAYCLQFGEWSLTDPVSREAKGPWVIKRTVDISLDTLPDDVKYKVGWNTDGIFKTLVVIIDVDYFISDREDTAYHIVSIDNAIKDFLKANPLFTVPYDTLYVESTVKLASRLDFEVIL